MKDATELAKKKGGGKVFEQMGTACRSLRGERVHDGWKRKKGSTVMDQGVQEVAMGWGCSGGGEEPQEAGSGAWTFS